MKLSFAAPAIVPLALSLSVSACASNPAPGAPPSTPPPSPAPADAAVAAVPVAVIDAAPAIPADLADAPAWVFRFNSPNRVETWTLRWVGDRALLVVEGATTTTYVGSATDGASLKVDVSTSNAKMSLDCKRDKLAASATCGDAKAGKVDVLACYAVGFDTPMSFGQPGIEYVAGPGCTGYRLIK